MPHKSIDKPGKMPYIIAEVWEALMASMVSVKPERLEARVTQEQKRQIELAARLRGSSVTEFVVSSAQEAANAVIREFEVLQLRDEARTAFVDALLNPPAPNEHALAAASRYKKEMGL
jgi:uncharacterized protein (DUF1778 family)